MANAALKIISFGMLFSVLFLFYVNSSYADEAASLVSVAEELPVIEPLDTKQMVDEGKSLYRKSKFDEAVMVFEKVINMDADEVQPYYWLGQIAIKQGDVEKGIKLIERSVELAKDNSRLWQALAKVYAEHGAADKAEQAYLKALTLSPSNHAVSIVLAQYAFDGGAIAEAIAYLENVIRLAKAAHELKKARAMLAKLYPRWVDVLTASLAQEAALPAEDMVARAKVLHLRGENDLAHTLLELLLEQVPDDTQARFWIGKVLQKQGKGELALVHIKKSAELTPGNAVLKIHLAESYEQLGDIPNAIDVYRQVIAMAGVKPKVRAQARTKEAGLRAEQLRSLDKHDEAIAIYHDLIGMDGVSAEVYFGLANSYESKGDHERATIFYLKAIAEAPAEMSFKLRLLDVYLARNDNDGAVEHVKAMLAGKLSLSLRGKVLERMGLKEALGLMSAGDLDQALEKFNALLAFAPNEYILYMNIGTIHKIKKEYALAGQTFLKVIEINPDFIAAYNSYANISLLQGDFPEGVKYYEKALARDVGSKATEFARAKLAGMAKKIIKYGRGLIDKDELSEAERIFKNLIERDPDNAQGHYWLGLVNVQKKDFDEAIVGLRRSVELRPDNWQLKSSLASAYEEAGINDKAISVLNEALLIEPENKELMVRLLALYLAEDDEVGAHRWMAIIAADEGDPTNAEKVLNQLGYEKAATFLDKKKWRKALAVLTEIEIITPDAPLLWLAKGDAYAGMKKYTLAEENYLKVLKAYPGHRGSGLGLARVLVTMGRVDEAIDAYKSLGESDKPDLNKDIESSLAALYERKALSMAAGIVAADKDELDAAAMIAAGADLVKLKTKASEQVFAALSVHVPDNPKVLFWWGRALMLNQKNIEAIDKIKKSVVLMPDNLALQEELGKAYFSIGEYAETIKLYQDLRDKHPENIRFRLTLAKFYNKNDDAFRNAELRYVLMLDRNGPGGKAALNELGYDDAVSDASQGDYDQAIGALIKIIDVVGEDAGLLAKVAEYYSLFGELDEAVKYYERSLRAQGKNTAVRLALARLVITDGLRAMTVLEAAYNYEGDEGELAKVDALLGQVYASHSRAIVMTVEGGGDDQVVVFDLAVDRAARMIRLSDYESAKAILAVILERSPLSSKANYWLGQIYLRQGQADVGVSYLKKSVAYDVENLGLKLELAEAYVDAGLLNEAESLLVSLRDAMKSAEYLLHQVRAMRYLQAGQVDAAVLDYKMNLNGTVDDSAVWLDIGKAYEQGERLDDAIMAFGQAQAHAPEDVDLLLYLAETFNKRGDVAHTEAYLSTIIYIADPLDSRRREAMDRLGLQKVSDLVAGGDTGAAIAALDALMLIFPEDPVLLGERAFLAFRLQRYVDADKYLSQALALNPKEPSLYMTLGLLLIKGDKPNKAISSFEKVISLSEEGELRDEALAFLNSIYSQRAEGLRRQGGIDKAIKDYRKILGHDPENLSTRMALAVTLRSAKKYEESLTEFNKVRVRSPDNVDVYLSLASVYAALNNSDKAAAMAAYAIMLEDDEEKKSRYVNELRINLVKRYQKEKDYVAAFRELDDLRRYSPDYTATYYHLAFLYSRAKDLDGAIASYVEIIKVSPNDIRTRFSLGVAYERQSEYELAEDQYVTIIRSGKADIFVERARTRLEGLKDRLSIFRSSLNYNMNAGEGSAGDNDFSSFGSGLTLSLSGNARPSKHSTLGVSLSGAYSGDHVSGGDSLSPTVGVNAGLNYDGIAFNARLGRNESHGLLLETMSGVGVNGSLSATLRFKYFFGFLDRDEVVDEELDNAGVDEVSRAKESVAPAEDSDVEFTADSDSNNDALKSILESMQDDVPEEIKRHEVKPGDTLWDIAEVLLDDPWLWPELWYANPNVSNPHLIFPGDTISLIYIDGKPKLILQRAGDDDGGFLPEKMSVEDGLAMYAKGLDLYRQGLLVEALQVFQSLLRLVPDDPLTNYYAGLIYISMNQYVEAEAAFRLVLALNPESLRARVKLAETLVFLNRFSEAIDELGLALQYAAGTRYIRYIEDILQGVYRSRVFTLIDMLPFDAGVDSARLDEVVTYSAELLARGDIDGATMAFERIIEKFPDSALVSYWLGRSYVAAGRFDKGIDYLHLSVAMAETEADYLLALALAYEESGDLRSAEVYFERVAKISTLPDQVNQAVLHLGKIKASRLVAVGNYAAAIEHYVALLEIFPDDVSLLLLAAEVYELMDELRAATLLFERVVTLDANNIVARVALLRLHLRDAMAGSAVADDIGDILALVAEREFVAATINKIVELVVDDKYRLEILKLIGLDDGLALMAKGDLVAALELFNGMLLLLPDDPLVLINMAMIYQSQGELDRAEALLRKVVGSDPLNLTARLKLGQLLAAKGRYNDAIVEFDFILSLGGDSDISAIARRRIDEIKAREQDKFVGLDDVDPVPKSLTASMNASEFTSVILNLNATQSSGGSLRLSYPTRDWGNWTVSYAVALTSNKYPLGRDYANVAQTLSLSVGRPVLPKLIPGLYGSFNLSRANSLYDDYDTNALFAEGVLRNRTAVQDNVSLSLSYSLHDKLRFSFSLSDSRRVSNLPVGLVYDVDSGVPVAYQGGGLGGVLSRNVSLGMQFQF